MHPVFLGTVAALSWGTLDFLAGLSSRRMGYVQTTAGVTLSGFLLLTLALAVFGPFPSFGLSIVDQFRSFSWRNVRYEFRS